MNTVEKKTAQYLLQINAIKLQPAKPFRWASGWNSPIYCDNRKTLSFPEVRNFIRQSFVEIVKEYFPDADVIAGVATGAIAHGALVAQELNLPFVYVRSAPKGHGLENLVEGVVKKGQKAVVIEDLISTGSSSLKAVAALRHEGCEVLGMAAIFNYNFNLAQENFEKATCKLYTLSNYNVLIDLALESGYIREEEMATLKKWREEPDTWGQH
ncbi:MAG: orotate phosphoribosyltransferase [Bacteroidia bacterium]|nr:orotate phosphoribosyltransferase [Bacteroidia bacterium]